MSCVGMSAYGFAGGRKVALQQLQRHALFCAGGDAFCTFWHPPRGPLH